MTARRLCLLISLFLAAGSGGTRETPSSFAYGGGAPEYLSKGQVFATWNAQNPKTALAAGLKIFFFGHAQGCEPGAGDGPTTARGNPGIAQAESLTGVRPDAAEWAWTPSADHPGCGVGTRDKAGDSFVVISNSPDAGGIGLFTHTGLDEHGSDSFFQPLPAAGRNGKGSNAFIEGTFVIFRLDWQGEERVRPWSARADGAEPVLELRTVQSVLRVEVRPGIEGPVQAKQQVMLTVINRDCHRQRGTSGRLCQIQYLFNTAVYRAGVTDWNGESWFKAARVWFDPQQGAMPVVSGPILSGGQTALDATTKAALYTSGAAASQHGEFADRPFVVRISFSQLTNAMRAVAASRMKRPSTSIDSSALEAEFGMRWNDVSEWTLLSIQFGQEVHNPSRERRAFIGGNMRRVFVGPAR